MYILYRPIHIYIYTFFYRIELEANATPFWQLQFVNVTMMFISYERGIAFNRNIHVPVTGASCKKILPLFLSVPLQKRTHKYLFFAFSPNQGKARAKAAVAKSQKLKSTQQNFRSHSFLGKIQRLKLVMNVVCTVYC